MEFNNRCNLRSFHLLFQDYKVLLFLEDSSLDDSSCYAEKSIIFQEHIRDHRLDVSPSNFRNRIVSTALFFDIADI